MQCERTRKNCYVKVQEVAVMLDINHGSDESTILDVLQFHSVRTVVFTEVTSGPRKDA
jgi:hypothetical protein